MLGTNQENLPLVTHWSASLVRASDLLGWIDLSILVDKSMSSLVIGSKDDWVYYNNDSPRRIKKSRDLEPSKIRF